MINNRIKGYTEAILSAASFGLIPLFSMPVLTSGMQLPSMLAYRFGIGSIVMMLVLLWRHENLHISWTEYLQISFLALLYAFSAICLISGYNYMPSGIATTLLFSYPVWTAILTLLIFHQKPTWRMSLAIILAFTGVYMLSGVHAGGGIKSVFGLILELLAGLTYAIYMVTFPHMRIRRMSSLKVNFYLFFVTTVFMMLYALFTTGSIQPIHSTTNLINLILLGILPTAFSNIFLVLSLKLIDSTHVAILGAFEPLTAMTVGIIVFGEPLTVAVTIGFALIIGAVMLLILRKG